MNKRSTEREKIKQDFIRMCEEKIKEGNGNKKFFPGNKTYNEILKEVKEDKKNPDGHPNIIDTNVYFHKLLKGEMTKQEMEEKGIRFISGEELLRK